MAVTALTKFTQGALVGLPGVALAGVALTQVDIENDDPTDVASWKVDLVYVPPGSALVAGVLATGDSPSPFASFTPDLPGCYRIILTVWDSAGMVGTSNVDIRNFGVPDSNGIIYPPYQELPRKLPVLGSGDVGEKPDELNFNQQPYGWDGNGSDGLMLYFMRTVSAALGAAVNFSFHEIPVGGVTVPLGQEMFVDQIITGPGILHVMGLVKSPPPGPPPFKLISPPQLVASVNDYDPTDFGPATNVNISAIAGPLSITGMRPNPQVRRKIVTNSGPNPWRLTDSDALSTPAAQFLTPGGAPMEIDPGKSLEIFRDPSAGKWRPTGE